MKNQRKELEQSIVTWEEDAKVLQCPFCQQEFSNYTFRRHHCRLCGRVVCGDPRTGCSKEVPLNVAAGICPLLPPPPPLFALFTDLAAVNGTTEKATADLGIDIRMCRDCQHTIFSSADFAASLAHKPPDVRAYENLVQFERGIRLLLPKFQRLLVALQYGPSLPNPTTQLTPSQQRPRPPPLRHPARRRLQDPQAPDGLLHAVRPRRAAHPRSPHRIAHAAQAPSRHLRAGVILPAPAHAAAQDPPQGPQARLPARPPPRHQPAAHRRSPRLVRAARGYQVPQRRPRLAG